MVTYGGNKRLYTHLNKPRAKSCRFVGVCILGSGFWLASILASTGY